MYRQLYWERADTERYFAVINCITIVTNDTDITAVVLRLFPVTLQTRYQNCRLVHIDVRKKTVGSVA